MPDAARGNQHERPLILSCINNYLLLPDFLISGLDPGMTNWKIQPDTCVTPTPAGIIVDPASTCGQKKLPRDCTASVIMSGVDDEEAVLLPALAIKYCWTKDSTNFGS